MSIFTDPAWRQHELPDADPDAGDVEATMRCQACGLDTDHEDMWLTPKGSLVCPSCYFRTWRFSDDA